MFHLGPSERPTSETWLNPAPALIPTRKEGLCSLLKSSQSIKGQFEYLLGPEASNAMGSGEVAMFQCSVPGPPGLPTLELLLGSMPPV